MQTVKNSNINVIENIPLVLNIDTATDVCSVALSKGSTVLSSLECRESNAHSRMLAVLIDRLFTNTYFTIGELDAVAVSRGPGSYTGLRIGVSSAKGIAYARNIPLIAVDTLQILALKANKKYKNCLYLPMIDARRMEVYTSLYDSEMNCLKEISADIIDSDIYARYSAEKIILVGDGAKKCKSVLIDERYVLDEEIYLQAKDMVELSYGRYIKKEFEDVAYFEPYYLKEFIAIKSKVKGLYNEKMEVRKK
ncbi:MAG: tRNA (adenosine(37)-N6)-threonylcarbamoyltransferase complex dimerization subunit type 1 TsaB [Bacteroidales bacterium]